MPIAQTLYRTLLTLTDMQRTAGSAADAVTRLDQRLQQIAETLKAYPNAPAAVKTLGCDRYQTGHGSTDGDRRRRRRRGGGGGFGGGPQPLRNRINSLKSEVVGSQSLPTQVQSTQVDGVSEAARRSRRSGEYGHHDDAAEPVQAA